MGRDERLHGLDHLRAIAILLVMVFHYRQNVPSWLLPVKQIGWSGVDLFFVLSGYLIGYQLLKEIRDTNRIDFKRFYLKRFFRIIPVFVIVLVIYYLLGNLKEGRGLPPLWMFLTFTQNLLIDVQTQNSFSHAWSLCIEEQFYITLPILLVLLFRFRLQKGGVYLMAVLFIMGFIFRYLNWHEFVQPFIDSGERRQMVYGFVEKVYYPTYNRLDGLMVGVGIAAISVFKPKLKEGLNKYANLLLLLGIVVFTIANIYCNNFITETTAVFSFPLFSIAYGLLVLSALSPTSLLHRFKSGITYFIAIISYSVYLTHKQVFHLTKMGIAELGWENTDPFWIAMGLSLLVGYILYIVVEKPFMKLRTSIVGRI